MLFKAEAREVIELARRIYRVLASRLPTENSSTDTKADQIARLQAKDALETLIAIVDRSQEQGPFAK
jgi:hypothetical protein